jgi:ubiquinone/menaquinone biosynthesis C-methylase UbiE
MSRFCDSKNANQRKRIGSYFDTLADFWSEVYLGSEIYGVVHQDRLRIMLGLAVSIDLGRGPRVLDVGSGAGYASTALAKRGYVVETIDVSEQMVIRTRALAQRSGVQALISSGLGDVQALTFPDESFDLVVALGVLPWLPSIARPLQEMARVLRPGGYLIANVDHRWGLSRLCNPATNPLFRPLKAMVKRIARRPVQHGSRVVMHSITECDDAFAAIGLEKVIGITLGFGPLRFFRWELLPNTWGLKLHRALQALAERHFPVVRSAGAQYLVMARKPAERPAAHA